MIGTDTPNVTSITVGACLSLTGRYERFGSQAAQALTIMTSFDDIEVLIEDDQSDPQALTAGIRRLAGRCDVLLGPYSTQLMRTASNLAAEHDWLLWNHGGSGDDIEESHPGHIISVPTPTRHYSGPFLRWLRRRTTPAPLRIITGKGSFARQVAAGALAEAGLHELEAEHLEAQHLMPELTSVPWDLFSAGTFEADVEIVRRAQQLRKPPRTICSVAAGVHDFADEVRNVVDIFGVGQWFPGSSPQPGLGPSEDEFIARYVSRFGSMPSYPAVQAAATVALATHCVRTAGTSSRQAAWDVATSLATSTLFGRFRIDPATGRQLEHEPVLVRWTHSGLRLAPE
ncbi:type 1 periplasmic-binding domain-containing protein [Jiangella alkaliphila]|uniref:ABC-type branched-chain amino acid transport system, substrate-binding protein n=1 Tax=Jiangella alkaliphila TaxID=419479 RepID=A0A1H2GJM0_9ACTN|nr:ABC transporter substrate-binding protein [Jiangella alkaliphila]SDU19649.1 ABC-type branched-chain amino acid transport system, substrate-binding protein [Jiangella alkaliphila]